MSWAARFRGVCVECETGFEPGTEIDYAPRAEGTAIGRDGKIEYRHAPTCPDDTPAPTKFEGATLDEMGF